MARNEEKANSLLNRWMTLRDTMHSGGDGQEFVLQQLNPAESLLMFAMCPVWQA